MDPTTPQALGFAHFLGQTDIVGRCVLAALLVLSMTTWYLILTRALADFLGRRRADAFLHRFAESGLPAPAPADVPAPECPFARMAQRAAEAADRRAAPEAWAAAGGFAEFLTRALCNEVDREAARVEQGLTVLASAGSASPYIGLFGTVWGIYHALLQIGMSGQGTLDKVAGPVGEALIMTALGLAVAIPAVLAHNAFNRRNRVWVARLEEFAQELYVRTVLPEAAGSGPRQASGG
ncbi:MAG: MotA/TolQ/ExbB proton channel family protein [Rhodocyclaceae bacterium]|nr:MotA/TolQ/ExbB proton channel family protein [Rhodocyclaceae bacterium]